MAVAGRKGTGHLWHPYSEIARMESEELPVIVSGNGVRLTDISGRKYLDGISSWWCVNLGHGHPEIVNAIVSQANRLQHSIIGGMSHEPVNLLSETLAEISPAGLEKCCFASDGASAVEASLRMAIQYWWNMDRPEKREVISLEGAYHGDTLGAVGLGYLERFHAPVSHIVRRSIQAPAPDCLRCRRGEGGGECSIQCFESMETLLRENAGTIAAVIVEPVCQGAAGIRIYPPAYVNRLRHICSELDILLILDEIAVGFGRTGRLFASELCDVSPDFLVLGKSLTGGYLPMSAVITTEKVYDSFRSSEGKDRTFYHGHTFAGNPLCSAAAMAAISIFRRMGVPEPPACLARGFDEMRELPGVIGSRSLGWMGRLQISEEAGGSKTAAETARTAMTKGLLVRPLGPVLYLWPPLVTEDGEFGEMMAIFGDSLETALEGQG